MGFGQRAGKFNELGEVISIRPNSGTPMTVIQSFQIQSSGQPASVIHARDPIFKPGTETVLESDALFFMPTESYDADGVPQYTQLVINDGFSNPLKVSEYNEYFTITKPGTMSSAISSVSTARFGSEVTPSVGISPKSITIPQTYRREGLVEVFLTTSNDADAEVAYSDDGVNWCSMSILDIFVNRIGGATSVASKFQTFPKYLVGAGATRVAQVGLGSQYSAKSKIVDKIKSAFKSVDMEFLTEKDMNIEATMEVFDELIQTANESYKSVEDVADILKRQQRYIYAFRRTAFSHVFQLINGSLLYYHCPLVTNLYQYEEADALELYNKINALWVNYLIDMKAHFAKHAVAKCDWAF